MYLCVILGDKYCGNIQHPKDNTSKRRKVYHPGEGYVCKGKFNLILIFSTNRQLFLLFVSSRYVILDPYVGHHQKKTNGVCSLFSLA